MDKGFDIPWIGDQNTMGRGFNIPYIGGFIYFGWGGGNTMGRGLKYHG